MRFKSLVVLGSRLKDLRISSGMKQSDLAKKAAISIKTVSSLEHGNSVSTETLYRVLKVLGYPKALDDIIPETPVSPLDLEKLAGKKRKIVR